MGAKKKVVISGYYGFDNSGDDAILKAIVEDLNKRTDDIEIIALSNNPSNTEKIYNIKAINRFNIFRLIKELYNADMLISGGGSLLQDLTSTRSLFYYLSIIYIAILFNKPVMIYANGIGPIYKKINRYLTKLILDKVDIITLRDYDSRKTLEIIGVTNKNIYVTADPVFTLEPSNEERVMEILKLEGVPTDKPLVGISVREWKRASNLRHIICESIDYLTNNYDINVLLIPMHYPEDLKISKEIIGKTKGKCYLISNKYSVEDLMGIIGKLDMIIAMRLHSLIYAATQAVPMIGLVYDPKVEGFLNLLELNAKSDVTKLDLVELCTLIEKVLKNKNEMKSKLKAKRDELNKKAYDNIDMVLSILRSR